MRGVADKHCLLSFFSLALIMPMIFIRCLGTFVSHKIFRLWQKVPFCIKVNKYGNLNLEVFFVYCYVLMVVAILYT